MTTNGFDEYGYYGENNGPLPPTKKIREMTEDERQRATVRYQSNRLKGKNNDQSNTD